MLLLFFIIISFYCYCADKENSSQKIRFAIIDPQSFDIKQLSQKYQNVEISTYDFDGVNKQIEEVFHYQAFEKDYGWLLNKLGCKQKLQHVFRSGLILQPLCLISPFFIRALLFGFKYISYSLCVLTALFCCVYVIVYVCYLFPCQYFFYHSLLERKKLSLKEYFYSFFDSHSLHHPINQKACYQKFKKSFCIFTELIEKKNFDIAVAFTFPCKKSHEYLKKNNFNRIDVPQSITIASKLSNLVCYSQSYDNNIVTLCKEALDKKVPLILVPLGFSFEEKKLYIESVMSVVNTLKLGS